MQRLWCFLDADGAATRMRFWDQRHHDGRTDDGELKEQRVKVFRGVNGLFFTLMVLRTAVPLVVLSALFGVHQTTGGRAFTTWINFLNRSLASRYSTPSLTRTRYSFSLCLRKDPGALRGLRAGIVVSTCGREGGRGAGVGYSVHSSRYNDPFVPLGLVRPRPPKGNYFVSARGKRDNSNHDTFTKCCVGERNTHVSCRRDCANEKKKQKKTRMSTTKN